MGKNFGGKTGQAGTHTKKSKKINFIYGQNILYMV